ncbi:uncharacterized protein LOC100118005 [Nasonia vitripennis]|uniref:N-acetyltransferase domain-containing protein n=1 Tax=Nasonia vitripennis TaxID=7425 RepID=A0A7M7QWP9_NASVI|nr:uncharacterized protein LOC100118005 [Nasonia vitripennis]XP_008212187.1 uncharacterized protein LOC100118005 [Nasonia vitripennis]XP_016844327.1 uncharacterized protein LOC100118005 [Nasonia vitripennis]XP_016844328.1 uncharacterized protein LOC100118005 [Nasonia vitripennis]XP_016844329.1 uncharacterized protein LOC100118005 [Nasonia vitripennis]XP_032454723.1 uncharacterized protein LOC100118005 [Nasonia vitripennis]XP_032454724.1 uncharacterized protein LOC100118005 [Nasonia vitripenni
MARWQRPTGPLNVWKVIDGYETLEDGTKKPVKFSVQEVPDDEYRRKEFLDLMTTYFLAEEPLSKSLNIKDDPDGVEGFQTIWKYGLNQGIVIACYKLDSDGKTEKLVGANAVFIVNEQTGKDFAEYKKGFKSEKFMRIWTFFEKLASKADVTKAYNVDKFISSISLSVLPEYRGQKLGYHILDARSAMAKKYGFTATSTMFTAEASQLQAKRSGFEEGCSADYADAVDDEGNPLFPNITAKCSKIMMKRLP